MTIRFAIWAAVSSKPQAAADKFSLPLQLERSRLLASDKNWKETTGPYIVSGQSREHYIQLYQAENELEAMRVMLADARDRKFDVLIMAEFDRLRGLMTQVLRTLAQYQVQLYSLSMPIDPLPPDEYNLYKADNVLALITMAQMSSSFEISRMRRKYMDNMPKRISERGLPKGQIPYGFIKPAGRETDRSAVPIADPIKSAVVIKIKDLFLAGKSSWQIAHQLNADHIPASRGGTWSDVNVRLILKNPYYAGNVIFGRTRRTTDPITGSVRIVDNDPSRIIVGRGAHQPLWDKDTQRLIEDEFKRRGRKYTGIRAARLSNLLYCGVCGARCWVGYPGGYAEERRRWYCSRHASAHLSIRDAVLLPLVIDAMLKAVSTETTKRRTQPADHQPRLSALAELTTRRARLVDALEAGHLDSATYHQRIGKIDKQIANATLEIERVQYDIQHSEQRITAIKKFAALLTTSPEYLLQAPAQQVNAQLHQLIQKIIVHPTHDIDIEFR